jgi:hypothetical protein
MEVSLDKTRYRLQELFPKRSLPPLLVINGVARRNRPTFIIELHGADFAISKGVEKLNYLPVVLGSPKSVVEYPWNAYVVTFP